MAVELVRHSDSRLDRQQLARVPQQLPARRAADDRRALGVAEHAEAGADREPPAAGRRDAGGAPRRAWPPTRTSRRSSATARTTPPTLPAGSRHRLRRPAAASGPRVRPAPVVDPHGGRGASRGAGDDRGRRRFAASTSARRPTRCRSPTPSPACASARRSTGASTSKSVSLVEQVLQRDPAGVYGRMDFLSRDRQRQAVEELAAPSGEAQVRVALRAVESARQAAAQRLDRRSRRARRLSPDRSRAGATSRPTSPTGRGSPSACAASGVRVTRRSLYLGPIARR